MPIHTFLRLTVVLAALLRPLAAFAQVQDQGIVLLEPVGGVGNIPTVGNEGLGVFGFYFGLLYPWVVGMAAATAVLMAVVGGIQIIQAGGDQAAVGNGKNRLLISLGGLILILASAIIMNALNPAFYQ